MWSAITVAAHLKASQHKTAFVGFGLAKEIATKVISANIGMCQYAVPSRKEAAGKEMDAPTYMLNQALLQKFRLRPGKRRFHVQLYS